MSSLIESRSCAHPQENLVCLVTAPLTRSLSIILRHNLVHSQSCTKHFVTLWCCHLLQLTQSLLIEQQFVTFYHST